MHRALILAAFTLLAAPVASAQTAADNAKAAYSKGVEYFKAKKFRQAIVEFNKAYRHDKSAVLVYNMARAFEELEDYGSAIEFYRQYLKLPDATDKPTVEQSIRTLELVAKKDPAKVDYTINSTPSGAAVRIDGAPAGVTPMTVKLASGKHTVDIEKAGFVKQRVEVMLASAPLSSAVNLVAIPPAQPKPAETKPAEPATQVADTVQPPAEDGGGNPLAWTAVGVGGALLVGSVVTGLQALSQSDEMDKADAANDEDAFDDASDSRKSWALTTDVLVVLGAASVGTGLWLLLTDDEPASAGFRPFGAGVAYGGTF